MNFEQAFKNIDGILWKDAGTNSELDYTEQSSWVLFLRYLDSLEQQRKDIAILENKQYNQILDTNESNGFNHQFPTDT